MILRIKSCLFLCYTHFMKAVILCAGDGERLRPITEKIPKPLINISSKPILEYILNSLPDEILEVFIVIQEKHKIYFEEFLKDFKINKKISFLFQDITKKGTYYALITAKDYLKEDEKFLVLNGDDIFLKEDLTELLKIQAPCYGLSYKKLSIRYKTCDLDLENKKIINFRKQTENDINKEIPCFSGAFTLSKDFFLYKPVFYDGIEAGIPHTLFEFNHDVSFFLLKEWIQINTLEDIDLAKNSL